MRKFAIFFLLSISNLTWSNDQNSTTHLEKIVLGSGCFWGAEKGYQDLHGVIDAVSGYSDGKEVRPSYREITKLINKFNPDNHAEVVQVIFNKNLISLEEIIIHYLESHDPTQFNRQGNDIELSIVLSFSTPMQNRLVVEKLIEEYQTLMFEAGYGVSKP